IFAIPFTEAPSILFRVPLAKKERVFLEIEPGTDVMIIGSGVIGMKDCKATQFGLKRCRNHLINALAQALFGSLLLICFLFCFDCFFLVCQPSFLFGNVR